MEEGGNRLWMVRLERAIARRRRLVVVAWVALLAISLPFAFRQGEHLRGGGGDVPGSGSLAVDEVVAERLPAERQPLAVVLRAPVGAGAREREEAIDRVRSALRAEPSVVATRGALERAADRLRRERVAVVPLRGPAGEQDALDAARAITDDLDRGGAVRTTLVGQPALFAALEDEAQSQLRSAEAIGLPIVAVVLLLVFGSFAAASLPLALGVVAVLVTAAEIYLLSRSMEMSVYVTNIASMLGIGVAVDYSLFVLARFREEVAAGASLDEARSRAMATSGVAVAFSGVAVVCSLATLWLIDSTLLRSMALGAILVVAAAVLVAVTLLPALIGLLGERTVRRGRLARAFGSGADEGRWWRWTRAVMRRPALSAALATAVLLALAAPALDMETSAGPLRQLAHDHDARSASELVASRAGGFAGSVRIVIDPKRGEQLDRRGVAALAAELRRDRELARVTTRTTSGGEAIVDGASRHDAESPEARDLVARLESGPLRQTALHRTADVHFGGEAARIRDVSEHILGSMWRVIAVALALSFVVLAIVLRSLVLPLKAVVMNLLSIGAAYGVLVLAFNPVNTLAPPLVFAVVLGLSMDYEVFLLSRIRDRYRAHGDSERAVAEGLATSAGTITSAALIMTGVFLTFVFTAVPSVQHIGLGTAVAIVVDATLVRLVLVPATMQLFGDWNWWFPGRGRPGAARAIIAR